MVAKRVIPPIITQAQFIVEGVGFGADGKKENTKTGII
jgi:hypothetical protein